MSRANASVEFDVLLYDLTSSYTSKVANQTGEVLG
jgi:hypothetical protein